METNKMNFIFCISREARNNAIQIQHYVWVGLAGHSLLNCFPVLLHVNWSKKNGSNILW